MSYKFYGCSGLTSVTIPNSVTSIGEWAFYGCSGLTSVTIGNGITSIGESAFYGCNGLTSVHITDIAAWCAISFGSNPLFYAKDLYLNGEKVTDLVIPNSVTSIGDDAFSGCSGLTSVTIPNSVTSIGDDAFRGCSGLTSVVIPNSVTSIGSHAFYECSGLKSITIPQSVEAIPQQFLGSCTSLEDVYCYIDYVPSTSASAFEYASISSATLHIPLEAMNDYKSIAPWSGFGQIVALDGSGEEIVVKKCATPTIAYTKGKLSFNCATDGAECVSTITDTDIGMRTGNEVNLSVTYSISVYATLSGYDNSDLATATLCWIESNPKTEGVTTEVKEVKARAVLIRSNNGVLTITSEDETENTPIHVYNTAGQQVGTANMTNGTATVNTNMQRGEVAIVKIGTKGVKVMMK